jgi:hypothetical protein
MSKKIPLDLVSVGDGSGIILVRRFDTLGIIVPAKKRTAAGWGAMRLQQDLGFYPTKAKAARAVERADQLALPGSLLSKAQLRQVRTASP